MTRVRSSPSRSPGQWLRLWWPVALLVALSAGLRLFELGRQSLWSDEAVSWSVSRLTPAEMMALSEWDHHAPLYYLLLKLSLAILPASEAGVRAVSLAASLLALLAVLAFLAREWSRSAALYAGILLVFSSFDLYYAQEARMYTVLAAAWIISYISLVKALQGRPRWLAVWVVATVALAWTHMYGLVIVGANLAFVGGYLVLKKALRLAAPLADRALLLAALAVALAILPMARILLLHSGTSSPAAWVPQAEDLRDLYLLWTAGLTASRHRFLDGAQLALPLTRSLTAGAWFVVGTLIAGAPAVIGLIHAWRQKGLRRLETLLALTLILLPVAVAFGYAVVRGSAIWIQRPFLGAAYLIYLWAGIGFAALPWRRARWALAVLAVITAAASLLPYFTVWQKANARQAFKTMAAPDERNLAVMEPRYFASLAQFYIDPDIPLLAIEANEQGVPQIIRPLFETDHPFIEIFGRPYPVACSELAGVTDLWIYGDHESIRRVLPQLPGCILERNLWTIQQGQWALLPSLIRDTIDGSGWLQFDEVRDADWTEEDYRHINPGEAMAVRLLQANTGNLRLTIRHYDAQRKVLEIWADDQPVGVIGDGRAGGGWVQETLDLPATANDSMLIVIKNIGAEGAGISSLGVNP